MKKEIRKKNSKSDIVELQEDVRLPGTDVLLEKGDKIEVLKENSFGAQSEMIEELVEFGRRADIGEVLSVFVASWAEMEKTGIPDSFSEAKMSLINALTDWIDSAGELYMGREYWS